MSVAMPILLIEDDPMIGQSLTRALNDAGMITNWIRDGINGLAAIESGGYALILLDLGLPRKSGFDVLKSMRAKGDRTPLFIITARDEIDDRVGGLDLGADDYLVKPFGFKELMARIRGALRLHGSHEISTIGNGEITIIWQRTKHLTGGKNYFCPLRSLPCSMRLSSIPG